MAWNGSGNFQRTNGSFSGSAVWEDDANAGFDIVDSRHDTHDQDLAQGINNCLTKDGQNSPTADLNMNTFKHTNVGDGTARNHYATIGQLQDEGVRALSSVGGTANAITATTIPSISAYVTGAQYTFRAVATNSGATTLKIGTAPAVAIQRNVAALVGGEIVNGRHYTVIYDGSVFQLLNTTANPLFLDSVNNRVGVGTTAPTDLMDVSSTSNVVSSINRYSNDTVGPWVYFTKSRGTAVGTNTIVQSGDSLGALFFRGANGTTYTNGAIINAEVDGTPGASNDMPTRLVFATTADGSGTATERMRITSGGDVGIGVTPSSERLHVRGVDATSSNKALTISNSAAAELFFVRNDGVIQTGTAASSPYNMTTASAANLFVSNTGALLRSTSSLRYKADVHDYTRGIDAVKALRPVFYKGLNDGDKQFAGLIAEEVHDAGLSEFVVYNDQGQPDALQYSNMIALALKAIQELEARVAALEA